MSALARLEDIPGVLEVLIGRRVETDWPGPDDTFDVGLSVAFESPEAMRAYQPHPTHLAAIEVTTRLCKRFQAFYFQP
jgi:hypothetical protein